jgi:hypothetical protein
VLETHGVSASIMHRSFMDCPFCWAEKDWSCVGLSLDIYWPNSLIEPWWTMPWGATAAPAILDSAASGRQKEYPCLTSVEFSAMRTARHCWALLWFPCASYSDRSRAISPSL